MPVKTWADVTPLPEEKWEVDGNTGKLLINFRLPDFGFLSVKPEVAGKHSVMGGHDETEIVARPSMAKRPGARVVVKSQNRMRVTARKSSGHPG